MEFQESHHHFLTLMGSKICLTTNKKLLIKYLNNDIFKHLNTTMLSRTKYWLVEKLNFNRLSLTIKYSITIVNENNVYKTVHFKKKEI